MVVRTQWSGTQDGPFLGLPPSGNKVRFSTADFFRIESGKVAEHWDVMQEEVPAAKTASGNPMFTMPTFAETPPP